MEESHVYGDDLAAYCLTNLSTVLDLVFRCLSARQLCKVAKVCKFWNQSAYRVKSKRDFFITKLDLIEDMMNDCSFDRIQDSLRQFIKDSPIYPSAGILYTNRSSYRAMSNQKENSKIINKIYRALPPECSLVGCQAGGVIGSSNSQSSEIKDNESASLLLLPANENVNVKNFFIKADFIHKAGKDRSKWRKKLDFLTDVQTKLVLLHASYCDPDDVDKVIKMIIEVAGYDVIIAGGLANLTFFNHKTHKQGISGIAFSGNLTTHIIIHKDEDNKAGMISELTKLKNSVEPNQNTVMFMFTCVARDPPLQPGHVGETSWISEVFPRIPIVGMFAFGEIAHDPNSLETEDKRKSNVHEYTTVLVLCKF